jgi:hypothetical protein
MPSTLIKRTWLTFVLAAWTPAAGISAPPSIAAVAAINVLIGIFNDVILP